jgi:hypothetical protein
MVWLVLAGALPDGAWRRKIGITGDSKLYHTGELEISVHHFLTCRYLTALFHWIDTLKSTHLTTEASLYINSQSWKKTQTWKVCLGLFNLHSDKDTRPHSVHVSDFLLELWMRISTNVHIVSNTRNIEMKGMELANLLQISSHATLVSGKLCVALSKKENWWEWREACKLHHSIKQAANCVMSLA